MRNRRRIYAEDEMMEEEVFEENIDDVVVDVEPEATDLLFEAEDVAELVAEVTGAPVEVTVDDDSVTFAVDGEEYLVEPEGDEEILESVRRPLRGKRRVAANRRRRPSARPVRASRRTAAKPATRRVSASRRTTVKRPR